MSFNQTHWTIIVKTFEILRGIFMVNFYVPVRVAQSDQNY